MYDITKQYRYLILFAEDNNKGEVKTEPNGDKKKVEATKSNPAANSNPAKTDNRTFWQKTRDNVKTAVSNIGVKNEARAQWNSERNKAKSDLDQAKADYKAGKISADDLAKRENNFKNYKDSNIKKQRVNDAAKANAENIKKKTTELNEARKKEENQIPKPVLPSSPPPNTDTNGEKKGVIDKAIDKVKGVKDTVKNDFTKAMGNKDEGNTLSQNWEKLKNTWNSDENKDKGFFDKLKNVYDTHKDAFKDQYGGALRDIGVGAAALGGGGMLMHGLMNRGRPAYGANYGLRPPIQSGNMFGGGMNMLQNLGGIGKMLGMFSENGYNTSKYKYLALFSEMDFSKYDDYVHKSKSEVNKELKRLLAGNQDAYTERDIADLQRIQDERKAAKGPSWWQRTKYAFTGNADHMGHNTVVAQRHKLGTLFTPVDINDNTNSIAYKNELDKTKSDYNKLLNKSKDLEDKLTKANEEVNRSKKHGKLMRNLAIVGGAGALGLGALATSSILSRHKMNNALSNRFTGRIALKRAGYGAMIPHYRNRGR